MYIKCDFRMPVRICIYVYILLLRHHHMTSYAIFRCTYRHMYTCMHLSVCTHMHTCMHTHIQTYEPTCTYIQIPHYIYLHTYMHACTITYVQHMHYHQDYRARKIEIVQRDLRPLIPPCCHWFLTGGAFHSPAPRGLAPPKLPKA